MIVQYVMAMLYHMVTHETVAQIIILCNKNSFIWQATYQRCIYNSVSLLSPLRSCRIT